MYKRTFHFLGIKVSNWELYIHDRKNQESITPDKIDNLPSQTYSLIH